MPVSLSIKNVPDELAARLRERAKRSRRSLQRELLVILEEAVEAEEELTPAALLVRLREIGLSTGAEAAETVRADRDAG